MGEHTPASEQRTSLSRGRGRELRDAAWLSLVPATVAVVLGVLLAPRRASPEAVPLPVADPHMIATAIAADHDLAERARRDGLSGLTRTLGSAVRDFHTLEADQAAAADMTRARAAVDTALIDVLGEGGVDALLSLRAVQIEGFLAEVRHFEDTGEESAELRALAGGFVRSMGVEGWVDGRRVALRDAELRVLYKHMWNTFLSLDARKEMAPSIDEERVLYAFYLSHAHPAKNMREAIDAARRGASDAKACDALDHAERAATESWRLERIARIAAIDPSYPAAYARGVANWRRGDYGASADAFRVWLRDHPDGPLALRAQNYLRAAAAAGDHNDGP